MDVVYERCAGLDIHKKVIVACVLTPGEGGRPQREVRSFGTMTGEIEALAAWLQQAGVTQVAMESTGVYWLPVWNLLEERFTLVLVNPQHMKAVPGRKTDVKDSEWLAEAAQAVGKKKESYLQEQYRRLGVRRGKKKAAVAVGHTILVIIYHLLQDPARRYEDLGAAYYDERNRQGVEKRAVRRLERLGYRVTLEPAAA